MLYLMKMMHVIGMVIKEQNHMLVNFDEANERIEEQVQSPNEVQLLKLVLRERE